MNWRTFHWGYFVGSFLIFFLAAVSGFFSAQIHVDRAMEQFEELRLTLGFFAEWPWWGQILFIFFNNALKSFVAMVFGVFVGLPTIFFLGANGFLIGMVVFLVAQRGENSFGWIVLALLPHGIFELTAIFLATGYGLWLGVRVFRRVVFKELLEGVFSKIFRGFWRYVLPLLFLAAIVEVLVTPLFLG